MSPFTGSGKFPRSKQHAPRVPPQSLNLSRTCIVLDTKGITCTANEHLWPIPLIMFSRPLYRGAPTWCCCGDHGILYPPIYCPSYHLINLLPSPTSPYWTRSTFRRLFGRIACITSCAASVASPPLVRGRLTLFRAELPLPGITDL